MAAVAAAELVVRLTRAAAVECYASLLDMV